MIPCGWPLLVGSLFQSAKWSQTLHLPSPPPPQSLPLSGQDHGEDTITSETLWFKNYHLTFHRLELVTWPLLAARGNVVPGWDNTEWRQPEFWWTASFFSHVPTKQGLTFSI
jgi:hypothetical protein